MSWALVASASVSNASRVAAGNPRSRELRLLLPVLGIAPLGFAVTHIAQSGMLDPGPLQLAVIYGILLLGAHAALVVARQRGDELLLPVVGTLGAIGLVMLNRLPQDLAGAGWLGLGMAATQLVWFGLGLATMVVATVGFRDDAALRHYKYTWALAGVGLLLYTLVFGTFVNDARLWVFIGPFGFQPSELIKIVLVVFFAAYLAENRSVLAGATYRLGAINLPPLPYLLPMLVVFAAVMAVVVVGRDLGTALLFFGIFLTMLFVGTGRRSYVVMGMVLFLVGSAAAYGLFGHVRARVDAWLDPWADPTDTGYQIVQALYAFGRGGLMGEGLGQGLPPVGNQLPVPAIHNDFIFAAIGEELGLVGAAAVLALAALLVVRGLRVSVLARDDFSALLAVGLTASLGLQILVIVGGNLKVIPLTGVTFPFVSYGGSSLVTSFAIVGLLLALSHRSIAAHGGRGP